MHRIRVGFIGAGGNTRLRHLPGFAAIEDVELSAVANRSVASAQAVAAAFGVGRVESDWRKIVAADDIDAVCIGTWPNTHAEMTCAALEAGKHVLVEARMADSLAKAETMQRTAAARAELVAQIVPSPFTLEADELIRGIVDSGRLGELQRVSSDFATDATLDPDAPISWRLDDRISGINTMALGICYEPMQRWLEGDATVEAADARVVTPRRKDSDGVMRDIRIPEELSVKGAWNGAQFSMHQSSVESGPARCVFEINGTKGGLRYDVNARELVLVDGAGKTTQRQIPQLKAGGWAVEAEFVNSIRTGAPVRRTDFATGVRYMRFTDVVWRAWNAAG